MIQPPNSSESHAAPQDNSRALSRGAQAAIDDLTVVICTKDRQSETVRCIRSLELLAIPGLRIKVWDDGSTPPITIPPELGSSPWLRIDLQRSQSSVGYIKARNGLLNGCETTFAFGLDDDAFVLEARGILEALSEMRRNERIGSIALSQTDASGIPQRNQAGKGPVPARTTHFYGYGWLLRMATFHATGGFREHFGFYAEESDFAKRMSDRGWCCIWWPDARVAHVPSNIHRSNRDVLRCQFGIRNRCMDAVLNEPILLLVCTLVLQSARYVRASRSLRRQGKDIEGVTWLWRSLRDRWSSLCRERRPLSYGVFLRWARDRRLPPRYRPASR